MTNLSEELTGLSGGKGTSSRSSQLSWMRIITQSSSSSLPAPPLHSGNSRYTQVPPLHSREGSGAHPSMARPRMHASRWWKSSAAGDHMRHHAT
jgi:hypothetical protein